jgi:hypothetical protein
VIPGAIVGTPGVVEDQLFPEQPPDITVEPVSGTEQYVDTTETVNGNTRVNIEITKPGVNTDATTTFRDLITITHNDRTDARPVLVDIDQSSQPNQAETKIAIGRDVSANILNDNVEIADLAVGEQFRLGVGNSTTIGLAVDTEGTEVGETISTTFTIKAERTTVSIPPTLVGDTGPPEAEATVDIELTPGVDTTLGEGEVPVSEPVDLTATGSTVTSLSSLVEGQVDNPRENQAVIDGPFNISEDDPAVTSGTVQFTLDRQAVGTPSENLRIVHSPVGNEWTLLETDVTEQQEELILKATPETEPSGTVAVVDDSNVQFRWSGDLPINANTGTSASESVSPLTSESAVDGDRIQIQTGGAMPAASVFISSGNSGIVDRLKTTAGITEQVPDETTPPTVVGFSAENVDFAEPGSKEINVTLTDADGRKSVANTTIDVIDSSKASDSDDDGSDSQGESQAPSEEQTQGQEQQQQEDITAPKEQQPNQEQTQEPDIEVKQQTGVDVDSILTESLPEDESQPTAVIDSPAEEETGDSFTESESDQSGDTTTSTGSELGSDSRLQWQRNRV